MKQIFAPAHYLIANLRNEIKFGFMAAIFGVPVFILAWFEPAPSTIAMAVAALVVVAYFSIAFYQQSMQSWRGLLPMLEALSQGDLTGTYGSAAVNPEANLAAGPAGLSDKRVMVARVGQSAEFGRLMGEVKSHFVRIVTQARAGAERINIAAREITAGNLNLSHRTESQAATLEQTAAGMEQLAATVKANAQSCKSAQALATQCERAAATGDGMINQVIDTMMGIERSARRTSAFTAAIKDIAFQTNLLALNAAVEAARAGTEGRGFAVVAIEVRSLAQRAAEAAEEIKTLVAESVASAEQGGKMAGETGQTINGVLMSVKEITGRIGEIANASAEQSAGVEEISRSVVQLENVTQQNAALVEEATANAEGLEGEAVRLAQAVSRFKLPA